MKKPIIVLTGGGSGGHITPILAVAAEIKQLQPNTRLIYIGQKGDSLGDLPAKDPNIDKSFSVRAGKFRRYHGQGIKQLLDIKTLLLNFRDIFLIIAGLYQSWRLIKRLRPDVIFSRGGYVSVPVCLGGKLNNIPYITHDSDSTPSLANRLIARWALWHAVALPEKVYPYNLDKTTTVGVPISSQYNRVSNEQKNRFKQQLKLPINSKVVLITGGGNGAEALNKAVINSSHELLTEHPNLRILHFAGRNLAREVKASYLEVLGHELAERVLVEGYSTDHHVYSGAADLIIVRGGATSLAELAAQAKPCIIIPSPQLIWNVKNAELLEKMQAAVMLPEKNLRHGNALIEEINKLIDNPEQLHSLSNNIHTLSQPQAAHKLAQLIIKSVKSDDV